MLVIVVLFITFKKLPFLIRYVPDQYKTQKMCDKAILENGGTLKSIKIKTATKFLYLILFLIDIKLKKYVT